MDRANQFIIDLRVLRELLFRPKLAISQMPIAVIFQARHLKEIVDRRAGIQVTWSSDGSEDAQGSGSCQSCSRRDKPGGELIATRLLHA